MKYLLIEPINKSPYPPLGLMRIATMLQSSDEAAELWACEKKSVNSANLSFLWYTKKIWKELKYVTKKETSTQSSNDGG